MNQAGAGRAPIRHRLGGRSPFFQGQTPSPNFAPRELSNTETMAERFERKARNYSNAMNEMPFFLHERITDLESGMAQLRLSGPVQSVCNCEERMNSFQRQLDNHLHWITSLQTKVEKSEERNRKLKSVILGLNERLKRAETRKASSSSSSSSEEEAAEVDPKRRRREPEPAAGPSNRSPDEKGDNEDSDLDALIIQANNDN